MTTRNVRSSCTPAPRERYRDPNTKWTGRATRKQCPPQPRGGVEASADYSNLESADGVGLVGPSIVGRGELHK